MSLQRVRHDWLTDTYTFHSNTNPQIYLAPYHIFNFFLCKYIPLFPFCFKFLLSCISLIFSNFFSFLFSHFFLNFLIILSMLPPPIFCHLPTSHQLAFVIVSNIFLLLPISGKDCLCFLFLGLNIIFRLIVSHTNSSHLMFPEHLVYSGTGDSTFLPNTYRWFWCGCSLRSHFWNLVFAHLLLLLILPPLLPV